MTVWADLGLVPDPASRPLEVVTDDGRLPGPGESVMCARRAGKRTVRVTAHSVVQLLLAMSRGEVRIVDEVLPRGAAVAGSRWDADTSTLEIDVFHHAWPADLGDTIEVRYVERVSAHAGWESPCTLAR